MGTAPDVIKQQVISKDQATTLVGNGQWVSSNPESYYLIGSENMGWGLVTKSRRKGTRGNGCEG